MFTIYSLLKYYKTQSNNRITFRWKNRKKHLTSISYFKWAAGWICFLYNYNISSNSFFVVKLTLYHIIERFYLSFHVQLYNEATLFNSFSSSFSIFSDEFWFIIYFLPHTMQTRNRKYTDFRANENEIFLRHFGRQFERYTAHGHSDKLGFSSIFF